VHNFKLASTPRLTVPESAAAAEEPPLQEAEKTDDKQGEEMTAGRGLIAAAAGRPKSGEAGRKMLEETSGHVVLQSAGSFLFRCEAVGE
jgi:hypothetical protein